MRRTLPLFLLCLAVFSTGWGQGPSAELPPTVTERGGDHYVDVWFVPDYFPTIQAAIDLAPAGMTIVVRPGTYFENLDFHGKRIIVTSENGSDSTIIDGGGVGSVVSFRNMETQQTRLIGFTIRNGSAPEGGGVYCSNSSPLIFSNVIEGNVASGGSINSGGGIFCGEGSSPLIKSNTISGNVASGVDGRGGGVYCGDGSPKIVYNMIGSNASGGGGGVYCQGSSATIAGNFIYGNDASNDGGGIKYTIPFDSPIVPPEMTSNTIAGNSANRGGGVYFSFPYSSGAMTNTILWSNNASSSGDQIYVSTYSSFVVTYSDVMGGHAGIGNIDENPYFVNTISGDFHIAFESPCRDAGDSTASELTINDIDGDDRIIFDTVDIGADEVDTDLQGHILLVPDEYPSIQAAIDSAQPFDTVMVAPATYVENIDFLGKVISVIGREGSDSTIIDGSGSGSVVTFKGRETGFSELRGFTLRGGNATEGGGIYCHNSSPSLVSNVITGNVAEGDTTGWGGGIYCDTNSSPLIESNVISGNQAVGGGASGGGIYCRDGSARVVRNIVSDNSSMGGGGIYNHGRAEIVGNLVFHNTASGDGGGIQYTVPFGEDTIPPAMSGNTITENSASRGGGLFFSFPYSSGWVTNSIVWDNEAYSSGDELYVSLYSSLAVSYSDVMGGHAGTGNIDENPYFSNPVTRDFHIVYESPCRDAGDSTSSRLTTDIDGDPRMIFGTIDMGADEVAMDLPGRTLLVPGEFQAIQTAIDSALPLDTVLVAPSTYLENIDFLGKPITLISEKGADSTIIDGNGSGSVVTFQGRETAQAWLSGFTIRNGLAPQGGGIYCYGASPSIVSNYIAGNEAAGDTASNGGGIYYYESSSSLEDNVISSNTSAGDGGGVICIDSPVTITNNLIYSNSAASNGGGIRYMVPYGSSIVPPAIVNNTITENSASQGGGLYFSFPWSLYGGEVMNTIFWNNTASASDPEISDHSSNLSVTYCDVMDSYPGNGNLYCDPQFVTGPRGDFYLQAAAGADSGSCCVDQGDPNFPPIDGTTRTDEAPDAGIVDIGYHYPY